MSSLTNSSIIVLDASVDPSLIRITSKSKNVCSCMDFKQHMSVFSRLYTGTIMDTFGEFMALLLECGEKELLGGPGQRLALCVDGGPIYGFVPVDSRGIADYAIAEAELPQ